MEEQCERRRITFRLASRTIRTHQPRAGLAFEGVHDLEHNASAEKKHPRKDSHHPDFIRLRDTFRYTYNERNLIFDGFDDGVSSERGRNVYNGRVWLGFSDSLLPGVNDGLCRTTRRTTHLLDAAKHGKAQMRLTSLAGGNTANHFGAIGNGFLRVKCCLQAKACVTTLHSDKLAIRTVFPVNPWHMTLVSL